jgi:phage/plasmid-associated DNA primase
MIPFKELAASGIDRSTAARLNYCCTPDGGWEIPYLDAEGRPYTYGDGDSFVRRKLKPGSDPKYLTPPGAGNRPYLSPLLPKGYLQGTKPLLITEGEKKADSLTAHGFPSIGLTGVYGWRDKRSGTAAPIPELAEINWKRPVYIVFDSDVVIKPQVLDALRALTEHIVGNFYPDDPGLGGHVPSVVFLPSGLDGEKNGADDFIVRHGADAFRRQLKVARPAVHWKGDTPIFWSPEADNTHHIAQAFIAVLKERYAIHPTRGTLKFNGKHWEEVQGKQPLLGPLHRLMDEHDFHRRGRRMIELLSEVETYLQHHDWDDAHLAAFSNGTLDLNNNILRPGHNPSDRLTFAFPFRWDPKATCSRWLQFIEQTFDEETVEVFRAAVSWTIKPKEQDSPFPFEKAFDVEGPKGSGKGVIAETLTALCGGTHGVATLRPKMIGCADSMQGLQGKKAAIDYDSSGIVRDPGQFNSIVSNEPVQVWRKFQNRADARLGVVIWRFFNDLPGVSDAGGVEGMQRRIFNFSIAQSVQRKDPNLKAKLRAELPGILQWAWSLSLDQIGEAFDAAGRIASISEASIEAQLNANPWLKFLIEVYPDGINDIAAKKLFERYRQWCDDEGRKGALNLTNFGKKLKKLLAPEGVKGSRLPVVKRHTNAGYRYDISPMRAFDLALFFGLTGSGEGFDPSPVNSFTPNPPPPDPAPPAGSQSRVNSVNSFSPPLHAERNGVSSQKGEKPKRKNPSHPSHPSLPGLSTAPIGSAHDVESDDDDPHWGPKKA